MNKDKKIDLETLVRQMKDLFVTEIDGEKVMMHIENGKYYAMNEVGSRIWDLIENPISVEQLIITLYNEYEVERSTCEKAVFDFLESVYNENLIEVL